MEAPVLVIMAAGMGSRYGGLKQIDPVDEQGNLIIDFSIYDAMKAGFKKVVFIIKHEIEDDFKKKIGNRISSYIGTEYVYQRLDDLPSGYSVPDGRIKPWGTGHAVLSCRKVMKGPFAVINADDYYGRQAYLRIYQELTDEKAADTFNYSMIGYRLENTLTEHGHVARGICSVNENGMLEQITERTHIEKRQSQAVYTEDNGLTFVELSAGGIVSMNLWGFQENIIGILNDRFAAFLEEDVVKNPLEAEYFLPAVVGDLIQAGTATVKVLQSEDKWYGVTYKEDKKAVVDAIHNFKEKGLYPEQLWN